MDWIKEFWRTWIEFTEFRAMRFCYIDQQIYGNSVMVKKWWGFKHIPYLEYCQSGNIAIDGTQYDKLREDK